ncbi:hypothetical protein [Haliovirga abyssi]|uniref:Uncharacterized protein n=1 Tax=Haliovirga abyssi TaxID=2996794 RepID=A0AAU9DQ38_9FUSO|nr:hypothetical protein [Haliovirga abyssi]BDU50578.1 hypothetical protein HLVA_11470 [Haliovirga abyssi]
MNPEEAIENEIIKKIIFVLINLVVILVWWNFSFGILGLLGVIIFEVVLWVAYGYLFDNLKA